MGFGESFSQLGQTFLKQRVILNRRGETRFLSGFALGVWVEIEVRIKQRFAFLNRAGGLYHQRRPYEIVKRILRIQRFGPLEHRS